MEEKLNLTNIENWDRNNAREIALILKFVDNAAFLTILDKFIEEIIPDARITRYLDIVAKKYFRSKGADSVIRE